MIKEDLARLSLSGAKGASSPKQTSDNLFSTDIVEVLLGISEGPILGLKDGGKSFFIGDTALQATDGTNNFDTFELVVRQGSELGENIQPRSGGFSTSTSVSTELATLTPVIRTGSHPNIDYIDVRLVINRLLTSNSKGTFTHTGKVKVEYKRTVDSTWLPVPTDEANPTPPVVEGESWKAFYGKTLPDYTKVSPGDRPTYLASTAPITTANDALWFNTSANHEPRRWVGGAWVTPDYLSSYAEGSTTVWRWHEVSSWGTDRLTRAYIGSSVPTSQEQGDFWVRPSQSKVYFYNGSSWIVAGSSSEPGRFGNGSDVVIENGEIRITGKTSSPYVKEFRFPVTKYDGTYDIRVTKTSPANTEENLFDVTWESFQEVVARVFNFPALATTQLTARASEQFSSIPDFTGIYAGRIIKVPSNYDPVAKTYGSVWDGTWKLAYTNNPAYIVKDLVENDRYGINAYYPVVLNKWDVYDAGVWCDTRTIDGRPRFTFNGVISDPQSCREAVDYVCGIFGGRYFDCPGSAPMAQN